MLETCCIFNCDLMFLKMSHFILLYYLLKGSLIDFTKYEKFGKYWLYYTRIHMVYNSEYNNVTYCHCTNL